MSDRVTILIVDDDDVDCEKVERSCRKLQVNNTCVRAHNGLDALDHLRGTGGHEKLRRPYVVLLDLNMPCMGGLEFLEEIRHDPELRDVPVFVLTTSNYAADVEAAHRYNVCGYIVKPLSSPDFTSTFETLNNYWQLCLFPERTACA